MLAVVVQIDGWDPLTVAPVTLRAASHDDATVCHLSGQTWWPAIATLPTLRYDLFDGAFAGQIAAPASTLTLQSEPWPDLGRYMLADARFRLWTGKAGADWSGYTLRFDGRVSAQPELADGKASVAFAVDDRWLDTALLPTYAGTTGAEGPAALKGQVKPLALGTPRYVAGTLVDSVNCVFQLSAFGFNGVEAALERLARFSPSLGDFSTFAALVAAALPPGTWATSRAGGFVRFGAPTTGQVSFLLQGDTAGEGGWVRRPGTVIRRLAQLAGGADKIDGASLTALDAARPYNLSLYLDQQTTAREQIQRVAASINAVAGVSWLGQLFVVPVGLSAPTLTLAADGSSLPPVGTSKQIGIDAPFRKLAIGAERAWTVHQLADIAFTATIVDTGAYAATTTYREGNIVQQAGSSWLYTNPTPSVGNTPPTLPTESNSWWRVLAKAGANGADGASAYSALLTNESHTLPADPAGNTLSYAGAAGTFRVFYGATDVSGSFALATAPSGNPQALAVAYSGQGYTVTDGLDPAEAIATLTIRATGSGAYAGVVLDKVFSLGKSNAGAGGAAGTNGAAGANAKLLYATSTAQTIAVDAAGALDPGGTAQAITFLAVKQNTTATVTWRVYDQDGNLLSQSDGDTLTIAAQDGLNVINNAAAGAASRQMRVTATLTDGGVALSDTISVVKVQAGANGTNGTSPALISITATPQLIRFDKNGNVYPNQAITFTATRQNTTAVPTFTFRKEDGTVLYSATAAGWASAAPSGWSSSGPDSLTEAAGDVATAITNGGGSGYIMEASAGGAVARVSVKAVKDGADGNAGAPGQSAPGSGVSTAVGTTSDVLTIYLGNSDTAIASVRRSVRQYRGSGSSAYIEVFVRPAGTSSWTSMGAVSTPASYNSTVDVSGQRTFTNSGDAGRFEYMCQTNVAGPGVDNDYFALSGSGA